MNLDLAVLGVLALFAVFGALSGAARQIANVLALAAAYLSAGPVAKLASPWLSSTFGASVLFTTAAVTLVVFLAVWILGRLVLIAGLQRLFTGEARQSRDTDRALGAVLGATKAAVIVWVLFSALTFVERNVEVGGRRFKVPAPDSKTVTIARRWNLFELAPHKPARELRELRNTPEWRALEADPRFRALLQDERVRAAIDSGDMGRLLDSAAMRQLLSDPELAGKFERLAGGHQR